MLQRLRNKHGLSQVQAADLMDVPHRTAVSAIETGRRHLRLEEFARLAVALNLSDEEIAACVRAALPEQRRAA